MKLQPVKGKNVSADASKSDLVLEDLLVVDVGVDVVLTEHMQEGIKPTDDEILIISFCEV